MAKALSLALLAIIGCANAQNANLSLSTSCRADVFVPDTLKHPSPVVSPNGRFRVILGGYREERDSEGGNVKVFDGETMLGQYQLLDLSAGIFVKWSPDSHAFYVMWSNGGMIGGYSVRVFRVSHDQVTEIFPTKSAEKEFSSRHDCRSRGINVFAVRWLNGSDQLQIATQVYPTSDCGKQMGITRGYSVRLDDGTILTRYSQQAIEKEMTQCPSPIWPTGLWSDEDLRRAKTKLAAKGNTH